MQPLLRVLECGVRSQLAELIALVPQMIAHGLDDGCVLRSWHAGAPVVGIVPDEAGGLVVATRTGLRTLDAAWRPVGALALDVRRLRPLGPGRVLVGRDDQTLELLAQA